MQRVLVAAAFLLLPTWGQDLPVISVAGGQAGQPALPGPAKPALVLPPLPVTHIDPRNTTLDSPRRLSLSFLEPRPIDEVLGLLTAGTPFSVSIDADASGSFRGEIKQLTLREALTTMLAPLGLDFEVRGTVLRVQRRQVETRFFDLNLLNVQRGLARTTGGAGATATLGSAVGADDVMGGIANGVRALLSDAGRVHVDPRAGLAQVTDYAERLDRVALYIETLHRRSGRQVRLQAQVFEVTLRDAASIDWRLVRRRLGLAGEVPAAGLAADPAALRAALLAQGEVRTLWAPDVTTLNNEPVLVRVATPGGTSLTMTVLPQVSADGIVQLSVAHAWEERADPRMTESDTVTRVMDGNTVMISGLLRPVSAVATGNSAIHAELVVLLRPTVVGAGVFATDRDRR
jgi:type II secretory pathway component GspD/PulD (secretin)